MALLLELQVCNHRFHNECLMRWADTSCPVCRYCLDSEGHVSHCATCNAAADLWICLICGHIGCGRYRSGHANGHWKDTNHCYALELETQRVRPSCLIKLSWLQPPKHLQ
jgi:BRCA1-associated protein